MNNDQHWRDKAARGGGIALMQACDHPEVSDDLYEEMRAIVADRWERMLKPQRFEDSEATRQRVLVDGMDCLPGQLDLF